MPVWLALIDPLAKLLDKLIPDPEAKARAIIDLKKEENAIYLQELQTAAQSDAAQNETNKIEAANESLFVSGWRPFIGWICGVAFIYKFILQPFMIFILVAMGDKFDYHLLPNLDWAEMSPVLLGMLGLGGLRTIDKRTVAKMSQE